MGGPHEVVQLSGKYNCSINSVNIYMYVGEPSCRDLWNRASIVLQRSGDDLP